MIIPKFFTPHKVVVNNPNNEYGFTINFHKELFGNCLGFNIYFGRTTIHLGLLISL